MKRYFGLLFIGGFFLFGCEEDPVIQTSGFQTKPVIYSIICSQDSIHFIRIGRFFSGYADPDETTKIPDSVYFRSSNLKVNLLNRKGIRVDVPVKFMEIPDKDPGMFTSDGYGVYVFEKKLIQGYYPAIGLIYDSVFLELSIPGLPSAKCSTSLVQPPRIYAPFEAQTNVYIYPDNPLRIVWSGDAWNEIDVGFSIMEEFPDSTVTRNFFLQKTNDIHWNGKYYEIKVPYELVVQMLEKNLVVRTNLIRRYFGPFRIEILSGNQDFDNYMRFRKGINDFNFNPLFNVNNGLGMLSARSATIKKSMFLDQASRLRFVIEPGLRKFRFIEY